MGINPVQVLPKDVVLTIFSLCEAKDLGRCCQVSKEWNNLASDDRIWKSFGYELPSFAPKEDVKGFLGKNASLFVRSNDALVERIRQLVESVQANENGKIEFFFPPKLQCPPLSFEIKLDPKQRAAEIPEFDVVEKVFVVYPVGEGKLAVEPQQEIPSSRFSVDNLPNEVRRLRFQAKGWFKRTYATLVYPFAGNPNYTHIEKEVSAIAFTKLNKDVEREPKKYKCIIICGCCVCVTAIAGVVTLAFTHPKDFSEALTFS